MSEPLVFSDWDLVKKLLPADWEASARQCGAVAPLPERGQC
jgi:hypothetical protein